MVSNRCKIVVKEILRELDLHFILVDLGEVEIMENITFEQREILNSNLLECGLEIMDDKKSILIEKIKSIIINLILHTEENIKVNFSCYLSEKLNHNYTYLFHLLRQNLRKPISITIIQKSVMIPETALFFIPYYQNIKLYYIS